MKKLLTMLLIITVICSGCSGNQKAEQKEDNQKDSTPAETTESLITEKSTEEASSPADASAESSAENKNYGKTAAEFLASAPVEGKVTNLTDTSFAAEPAFAGGDSMGSADGGAITNVVYDPENVNFKTASVKSDGSSYSVSEGQRGDLKENANVLVFGKAQDDGTFEAEEIIVVKYG